MPRARAGDVLPVTIKQKNPGWLEDLQKKYKSNKQLAIGYPIGTTGTSTKYPDGTPVLLVAAANNFGAPSRGVPARDFMDQGAVRALEKTGPITAALIPKVNAGGMTLEQLLDTLGPVAVAEFQQTIVDFDDPANSDATIKAKGSSNPLVDTSLMNQTLTHIVRSK